MKKIYFVLFVALSLGMNAQNFVWTAQTSPTTDVLRDVYFTDNMNGWAVGDKGTILHTNDGGQIWTAQTSGTTLNLTNVNFIDANIGYAVGGFLSSGNVALKTTNGGTTWSPITIGNTVSNYNDVEFSSVNNGIVITSDSIYTTSDAGVTWIKEGYVTSVTGGLNNQAISSFNDTISLVCGSRFKTGTISKQPDIFNRMLYNAPLIWGTSAVSNFDQNDIIKSVEVAGPTRAFAGGEEGIVYKFESVGPNYSGPWNVSIDLNPVGTKQTINSISFPTDKLGMFNTSADTNGNSYALIYHTIDEGNTWTTAPDSIMGLLGGRLHAPTPNDAWIVGSGGKIYKGSPKPISVSENFLAAMRLYPNPAKEQLNINLGTNNNDELNYRVIDITGKTLMTGVLGAGSRNIIDVSYLSQGVYFITISDKNGSVKTSKFNKI